jgi:hypothetical protein
VAITATRLIAILRIMVLTPSSDPPKSNNSNQTKLQAEAQSFGILRARSRGREKRAPASRNIGGPGLASVPNQGDFREYQF